jgi:hypothetical protein
MSTSTTYKGFLLVVLLSAQLHCVLLSAQLHRSCTLQPHAALPHVSTHRATQHKHTEAWFQQHYQNTTALLLFLQALRSPPIHRLRLQGSP